MTPLWRRYARLLGPDPRADVRDELRFHLETKVDDLVAQGWNRQDALREAERQFGDLATVQQMGERLSIHMERNKQRADFWGALAQDLRYAVRTLLRERAFAIIAILILALGIGANTAVFSVINTVLLRPLPFPDGDQLVWFTSARDSRVRSGSSGGLSEVTYTVAAYEEFARRQRSFQHVTCYNPFFGSSEYTLTGRGEAQALVAAMVEERFFQTLGLQPEHGRFFLHEEAQKGGRPAVLLSHAFWRRRFGGDSAIIGQAIILNKVPVTVVGILPSSFDFGSVFSPGLKIDIYVPAIMDDVRNWGNTLALVGRLKPGVSVARAQTEADIVFPAAKAAHPEWWGDYTSSLTPLKEFVSGKLRRSLVVLWCAVGLILLIVCVNLSNLMLSRAAARSKEFAMRSALGAGRGRLFRQLLTESLVLSAAGACIGLLLALGLTFYLRRQSSIALPLLNSISVDGVALAWTVLTLVAIAMVIGLAAAFKASSRNLQVALKDSGPGMSAGRTHERLRATLVVSEVALACVLLVGAGLLLRSFLRVLDVDLGFQPARASVIKVDYEASNRDQRVAALREMLRRVETIPGIEAVGIADMLPLGRNRSWGFSAKGKSYPKDRNLSAIVRIVTPGYLRAMGMRLQAGRDFTWEDKPDSQAVVIINETAARYFWEGEEALHRMGRVGSQDTQVIGILSDVRDHSLEVQPGPEMYLPMAQAGPEGAELVVRSQLPPQALAPALMKTLRSLNPDQPAEELRPLQRIVDQSVSPRRFFALLVAAFAALGLLLASLGIYGVISYSVARRTQEIGVRMALGATAPQVQLSVIGRALRMTLAGVAVGAVAALIVARSIASLLFGIEPSDPAVFTAIIVLLTAVALIAAYIPARRAAHVDPMLALRGN